MFRAGYFFVKLSFNQPNRYKILQIAGGSPGAGFGDPSGLTAALDAEEPDLLVVTGAFPQSDGDMAALKRFCALMETRTLRWAFVPGACGENDRRSRDAAEALMLAAPGCVYERGPEAVTGEGNYEIRLIGTDGKICWALYFFDTSRALSSARGDGFAAPDHSQVEWYIEKRLSTYAEEETFASLLFLHRPLPEHWEAYAERGPNHALAEKTPDRMRNGGLFSAVREDKRALGVFCGEVFDEALCLKWQGVALGSAPSPRDGCRVLSLNESGERPLLETYVRLWDGTLRR